MKNFPLVISSPDGDLFNGEVLQLILRGSEGDLAVLAGHVPFVTNVQAGKCSLILPDETRKEGTIGEGLLTVDKQKVTVLTASLELEK
ncbi:MAG: hypothetical protein CW338_09745 [Clostridiales bacterium]|nr:hypothetical protein [Clostridiales bacterium]